MTGPYVIIGTGIASAECIEAARASGYSGEMTVISDVSLPPFNPMLVTYFASDKIEYGDLFPYSGGQDFYEKYNITRQFGAPVVSLDAENKIIKTADGRETGYEKCVIATGASPVLPEAFSSIKDEALMLRTAEDAERFKALLGSDRKHALVIGCSMIGIKAVEGLAAAGFTVTFADFAETVFPMASHEHCSLLVQRLLEEKNVRLLFGSAAEEASKKDGQFHIRFSGRPETETYDAVIVCAGVRPNISFINKDQIKTDRGVLVNEYMETSAEGVYAAGDVCQAPGIEGNTQVLGLVSNARLQGRTVGQNLAGKREKYAGTVPHNLTHFLGNDFIGIGDVNNGSDVYEETDETNHRYIRLVFSGKKLTGVNLLNIPEISGILKYHLTKGLLVGDTLQDFAGESLAMNRLFEKYPRIEKVFAEKR